MNSESRELRILSIEELRALSPNRRAEYIGQLAARSLNENMAKYDAQSGPSGPSLTFDRAKAREHGMTASIVVIALLWIVIYVAYAYLSRPLGEDLAAWLSLAAGVFVAASMFPVQNAYAYWETRRFCSENGHLLEHHVAHDGRPFVSCKRCYEVMVSERAIGKAHPNP